MTTNPNSLKAEDTTTGVGVGGNVTGVGVGGKVIAVGVGGKTNGVAVGKGAGKTIGVAVGAGVAVGSGVGNTTGVEVGTAVSALATMIAACSRANLRISSSAAQATRAGAIMKIANTTLINIPPWSDG